VVELRALLRNVAFRGQLVMQTFVVDFAKRSLSLNKEFDISVKINYIKFALFY